MAIYFSKANEKVKLISDNFNLNNLKKMTIYGGIKEPIKRMTFINAGNHTIYYSFNKYDNNNSSMNNCGYMFSGIENLLYAHFSYLTNYLPNVKCIGMFNNCINLKETSFVFLAKSKYNCHDSLDYMFNNCISLNSLKIVTDRDIYIFGSTKYMFNNCTSLKSKDLSKIHFFNCSIF